jgi:hypothetical protein
MLVPLEEGPLDPPLLGVGAGFEAGAGSHTVFCQAPQSIVSVSTFPEHVTLTVVVVLLNPETDAEAVTGADVGGAPSLPPLATLPPAICVH